MYFAAMNEQIIARIAKRVEDWMNRHDASHDMWHIRRTVQLARKIQAAEGGDPEIITLAAYLHDVADAKYHHNSEQLTGKIIREMLDEFQYPDDVIHHIENIVTNLSFRKHIQPGFKAVETIEFRIVSDADKLDAIGAIGIARTFHFGGARGNPIYDPSVPLLSPPDAEAYRRYDRSTIHHFYDKLLKIKDMLYTETARKMAEERHRFMEMFLDRFFKEWNL